jgi:hypothetical protein
MDSENSEAATMHWKDVTYTFPEKTRQPGYWKEILKDVLIISVTNG